MTWAARIGGRRGLIVLGLCCASLLAVVGLRDREREALFGSDEPEWLAISVLHVRQLLEGGPAPGADPGAQPSPRTPDPGNPWMVGVQRTTFGYMNPCLAKLVWGTTLLAAGHRSASPLVFQSFHGEDSAAGQRAREALLPALPLARRVVMVFAALAASLLALVAREAERSPAPARGGAAAGTRAWLVAGLAWALWNASPLVRGTTSYLRTDHFMLTFLLATILWCLWRGKLLFGAARPTARAGAASVAGLFIGLAVSSKLNGSSAALGLCLCALAACVAGEAPPARRIVGALASLVVAGTVALLVFLALQPVTWADPVEGARAMLARWERHTGYIQNTWAQQTGVQVVRTPLERSRLFVNALLFEHDPLAALSGLPLGVPLAGLGVRRLLQRGARGGRLLSFGGVVLLVTALTLPVDWGRLYLPALAVWVLLEAIGAGALVAWIRRRRGAASKDAAAAQATPRHAASRDAAALRIEPTRAGVGRYGEGVVRFPRRQGHHA